MKTIQTITIGHVILELPAGMPSKDIQQLAGYLASLRRVESHGLWADDNYRNIQYVEANGPQVQLGELEVYDKVEADRLYAEDKTAREAKKATA